MIPRELIPLGAQPLSVVWENSLGPAFDAYLLRQQGFSTPVSSVFLGRHLPSSWSESTTALSLARPAWTPQSGVDPSSSRTVSTTFMSLFLSRHSLSPRACISLLSLPTPLPSPANLSLPLLAFPSALPSPPTSRAPRPSPVFYTFLPRDTYSSTPIRKRTSSSSSARAAVRVRRKSCLWGRLHPRAAARLSSLRLVVSRTSSTCSTASGGCK